MCCSPVSPTGISVSLFFFTLLNSQTPQTYNVENMWKTKSQNPSFAKTAFYFELIILILKRYFLMAHSLRISTFAFTNYRGSVSIYVSLILNFKSCRKSYSLFLFSVKGLTAHCCNKIACYEVSIHKIDLQHIRYWFSNFIINENYNENACINTQCRFCDVLPFLGFFCSFTLQFTRASLVQINEILLDGYLVTSS